MKTRRQNIVFLLLMCLVPTFLMAQVKTDWVIDAFNERSGQVIHIDFYENVYVAGMDSDNGDMFVHKFNSEGELQWTSTNDFYDGYFFNDIDVDLDGNIYLASQSFKNGGAFYTLTKMRNDGQYLWVRGSNTITGSAEAVLEDNGNVVVTGWRASGGGTAFWTQKYDGDGNILFEKLYNGPYEDGVDDPVAMKMSGASYFVTGTSTGAAGNSDYVTIRYDRDGNEVWVKRYDGSAGLSDQARDLDTYYNGADRYIAVTGQSRGTGGIDDYTTILYDYDGNELWVRRYFDPNEGREDSYAFSVDFRYSEITVTGRSTDDVATVKYDFDGNVLWTQRYNGPGDGLDLGLKLVTDANKNVYVTGRSLGSEGKEEYATIKYNGSGEQVWIQRYPAAEAGIPFDLAVERVAGRKVYVTGIPATIAYSDDGPDWCNLQWPPNGQIGEGEQLTVYTQAWFADETLFDFGYQNLAVWIGVNSANTDPATWDESAWTLAGFNDEVGKNAEYMADIGASLAPGTYYYASRFRNQYGPDLGSFSYGGYSQQGGGFWDGTENVSGTLVIGAPLAAIDGERDALYNELSLPSDGHIQIPIEAFGNGDQPANSDDLSTRVWMAWDENYLYYYEERKDEALIVNNGAAWQNDCVELKFDSDLSQPVGGEPVDNVRLTVLDTDLASEPAGVDNLNGDTNLKFANGDIWQPTTADYARFYPEDGSGVNMEFRVPWNVINTNGPINPAAGTKIGFAINIADNDGAAREHQLFWAAVISDNIWNTPDFHGTLELLADNKVKFIAQNSRVPDNVNVNADAWYTDPLTGIEIERTAEIAKAYQLKQNYPNPFNPTTKIAYDLVKAETVTLSIYDVNGKLINELVSNQRQPAGSYELTWDGTTAFGSKVVSGVYYYKLSTSSFVASKKMLLLK